MITFARGEHLHDALGYHLIVLGGSFGEASSGGQTEGFTFSLELGGSDLPIFRYDVDHRAGVVWKLCDLLGARMYEAPALPTTTSPESPAMLSPSPRPT